MTWLTRLASLRRRGRGVNGIAAAWALVWTPLFTLVGVVYGVVNPFDAHIYEALLIGPTLGFVVGLVAGWFYGIAFSGVLWLFERDRSLPTLSPWRVGAWGAIPGLLIGVLFSWPVVAAAVLGLLGAGTAYVMLRLALRDESDNRASGSPGQ